MQNLTAHYNVLFNANEILRQKQEDYALAFVDSYTEILRVYQDTSITPNKDGTLDKDLQTAVDKANKIINLKEQSHYIGDAYLVLGKANFLGGNYFNASEYFSYVIRTFPEQAATLQEALAWKTRTMLYLHQPDEAKKAIDTAILNINVKKRNPVDVYGAKLQYDIDVQDYADGEAMAKLAIQYCKSSKQRLRWNFILAQLQELNGKNDEAAGHYERISKSNAAFEMSFNAQLNLIRIEQMKNGIKLSRADRLRQLLKNPNNNDFKDQIYYQLAQIHYADKELDPAIADYKLSISSSVKNQTQKGLSYLRIADINFNDKADFVTAKKYYDSTLLALSPNYPGYGIIQKKTNNLQLLTDRLLTIAREDTLQMLAKLDDSTRKKRIDEMVNREILQQRVSAATATSNSPGNGPGGLFNAGGGANTFYFYNAKAVSQGYTEFKRIWGSRKLEDDWRRSAKISTDAASSNTVTPSQATSKGNQDPFATKNEASVSASNYRQQLVQDLPLTPELLAKSNQRIFNAYFDIASFYRDILEDKKNAIATDELLLKRFPDNPNKPAIYYSLYRMHTELNDGKADEYKNLLLKEFPETTFAKIILDPDYSKKLDDKNAEFNNLYNQVYDLYANKKYKNVVKKADSVLSQYPNNVFAPQLYYLRAIAAGHDEPISQFKSDLQFIANKYPNDPLIYPLVTQHLNYINTMLVDMTGRHNALLEADTSEVLFTPPIEDQVQTPYRDPGRHYVFATVPDKRKPEPKKEPAKAVTPEPAKKEEEAAKTPTAEPEKKDETPITAITGPIKKDSTIVAQQSADDPFHTDTSAVAQALVKKKPVVSSVFSVDDRSHYLFVINVVNNTTNLASSRFGIGQFNRVHYAGQQLKHQIMDVGGYNQLIYVGNFNSLDDVKDYARAIIPVMPEIMKITRDKYTFFIITKENLDKLANKKRLDEYLDFYQANY